MKRPRLVIDVGMHDGGDTAHYLSRGFEVLGIEANPVLVAQSRQRFATEIADGRLTILQVAIAAEAGTATLGVCESNTGWSTILSSPTDRSPEAVYRDVQVPAVTFDSVLRDVGIPHYLKVDIEGMDHLCIHALAAFDERPDYVSIESSVSVPSSLPQSVYDEVAALSELGYRRFAYVDQSILPTCTSGPFGDQLKVQWMTADAVAQHGLELAARWCRSKWWDLHAALEEAVVW